MTHQVLQFVEDNGQYRRRRIAIDKTLSSLQPLPSSPKSWSLRPKPMTLLLGDKTENTKEKVNLLKLPQEY